MRPSLLLASFVLLAVGCGGSSETLYSVNGKVLLDGAPLTQGTVTFVPNAAKGNKATANGIGSVKAGGTFALFYKGKEGAPAGWYKVSVSASGMPTTMPEMGKPMPAAPKINAKFADAETSALEAEVVALPGGDAYVLKVSK